MDRWDPDLYLKYEDERTQPSYDLVARIRVDDPANIIDIGCGPGNSTRVLREQWPEARVVGLDSSQEMFAKAGATHPEEQWVLADAAGWEPDLKYSIVFSSATLQWIPDHKRLIRRLFDGVQSGGALAVQVPANSGSPLHQAVLRVSGKAEWREATQACDGIFAYHDAGFYYDQLAGLATRIVMLHTTYYHVMESHQGLVDWYASTGMKPYLEKLGDDGLRHSFQSQVLEECRSACPEQADRKILFPFQRLFFVAYRA